VIKMKDVYKFEDKYEEQDLYKYSIVYYDDILYYFVILMINNKHNKHFCIWFHDSDGCLSFKKSVIFNLIDKYSINVDNIEFINSRNIKLIEKYGE